MITEKITTTDVKRMNKNRIFRLIHYADKISRQEIADVLQLSLPTVNQNLKLLTEENLIEFVGNFESTGGRKAQAITVKGMSKCAVSVNISSFGIKVALVDLKGEVICSQKISMEFTADKIYREKIAELVADVIKRNEVKDEDILGVGVTVPGIFDNDNKVILSAPTMGIKNYLVSELTQLIPYPCIAMNDARAAAYVEYWFNGRTAPLKKFNMEEYIRGNTLAKATGKLYLILNNGVGGSYIDKGGIQRGAHNRHGEFGHMTLYPKGKKCYCGKNGCFEAYVSSNVLSTELNCTIEEFFSQVQQGNTKFTEVFERYIDDLTTGINNLYSFCDSDIVVGGPVAKHLAVYEDKIREKLIDKYAFDTDGMYFGLAKCSSEQADTGAALTFLSDFINNI